ncbi:MAG: trehalose-6-phosphate synthase, partial [Dehalococcoidia bacterium]|nr:trehalose-6-phosphate synthase [Dehalococcoidia bacterium]
DGMNLVAKEGPIVSTRDSVLILSREAGAFEQLSGDVISVEPTDVDGTASALADALAMSTLGRRERASDLRAKIEKEDISGWITSQMDDIKGVLAERYRGSYKQAPSAFRRDWVPDFGMRGVFAAAPNS